MVRRLETARKIADFEKENASRLNEIRRKETLLDLLIKRFDEMSIASKSRGYIVIVISRPRVTMTR